MFEKILKQDVAQLPPEVLRLYEEHSIPTVELKCHGSEEYGVEHVFVVARAGVRVLLFDDVEEEFAIGIPDSDGILRRWDLFGQLQLAIRRLSTNVLGDTE